VLRLRRQVGDGFGAVIVILIVEGEPLQLVLGADGEYGPGGL
jgi:hypothetical protein